MKNICIVFNGGNYGTFLEWCLHYFTDRSFTQTLPFTTTGNAHNYTGHHLHSFKGFVDYINSSDDFTLVRGHIRNTVHDNQIENFRYVYNNFKKTIFLHCTKNTLLWSIDNKFEKIYGDKWLEHNKDLFESNLRAWGSEKTLATMDLWELREFLSYYLYDQHLAETEYDQLDHWQQEFINAKFVPIENLRDNFEITIKDLIDYCGLTIIRDDFDYVYNKWITVQYHADKDKLVDNIVNCAVNQIEFDWQGKLTIADEALVQYYLRQHGIELKCYNLNAFPTNTTDLRNYFELT